MTKEEILREFEKMHEQFYGSSAVFTRKSLMDFLSTSLDAIYQAGMEDTKDIVKKTIINTNEGSIITNPVITLNRVIENLELQPLSEEREKE